MRRYAQAVMANLSGDFYLGGHSKGGNLAVYAAAHLTSEEQQRIIAVYNNDIGPGFLANIIEKEGYQRIIHKVTTFIPQSSVAGILLEHGRNIGSSEAAKRAYCSITPSPGKC